jgi:hypothetical protein
MEAYRIKIKQDEDNVEFFKDKQFKGNIHMYFKNSQTLIIDPNEVRSAKRLQNGNVEIVTIGEVIEYDPSFIGFMIKAINVFKEPGELEQIQKFAGEKDGAKDSPP